MCTYCTYVQKLQIPMYLAQCLINTCQIYCVYVFGEFLPTHVCGFPQECKYNTGYKCCVYIYMYCVYSIYKCVCVYIYIYIYIYMYMCVYIYTCM